MDIDLMNYICADCQHLQDSMGRRCDSCGSVRVVLYSVVTELLTKGELLIEVPASKPAVRSQVSLGIDLIYCAGGNKKLVEIAYEAGFKLGVRSDKYHYPYPLTLVDVDYKSPDFEMHLRRVDKERPKYATVPDLSDKSVSEMDIARVIAQYERLKDYCEIVLVVPKLSGQIDLLPPEMAIGFSVPTRYGGAQYPLWELAGRKVHLLGGSPHGQMVYYKHVQAIAQVTSADGNMYQKMAIEKCKYWQAGGRAGGQWCDWPVEGKDQYFDAFAFSCRNIQNYWSKYANDS